MNSSLLRDLLKEKEQKRIYAELQAQRKKEEIYSKYQRLQEIDSSLTTYALHTVRDILANGNKTSYLDLQEKISSLKKEKEKIFQKLGLTQNDFEPHYECNICKDTGYISNSSGTILCNCIKQKLFDLEYNKSNISNLEKENFNNFNINLYSDEIDNKRYNSNISPRTNIQNIQEIAKNFILNFDNPDEKNLLFTGNTGLGKTFLSNCIAKELLDMGKTVLYQTSSVMLDTIIDYRFGKENISKNTFQNLFDVDLLIIDDLGTETMNSMKFTELFNIINTRMLNQNNHITKTIISTNLSLQNLFSTYDERIVSRLIGSYNICRFFGEDIRLKKPAK